MNLMITEVQITCVVLMILLILVLAFVLPRHSNSGKNYDFSRKLLLLSLFIIAVHFSIQYFLHKHVSDPEYVRTSLNLLFGFPISFFVNMSLLYLQRRGEIRKREWFIVPILFLGAVSFFSGFMAFSRTPSSMMVANVLMALLYAVSLLYTDVLQLKAYFKILRIIRDTGDRNYILLVRWTRFSMFLLMAVSFGFPFMTFNTNLTLRSVYGIIAISAGFLYTISFMGYGLCCSAQPATSGYPVRTSSSVKPDLSRNVQMASAAEQFIESGYYLNPGITLKDVADHMKVSSNMLVNWLRTTEYVKFNNWINYLRIQKAKELMVSGEKLSSGEIASRCGFCDRQYFQTQFRKMEGVTPAVWSGRLSTGKSAAASDENAGLHEKEVSA